MRNRAFPFSPVFAAILLAAGCSQAAKTNSSESGTSNMLSYQDIHVYYQNTNEIRLRWDHPAGYFLADHFNIYRSVTPGSNFQLIASTGDTNYIDTNVSTRQRYYYQISAADSHEETPRSSPVEGVALEEWHVLDKVLTTNVAVSDIKYDCTNNRLYVLNNLNGIDVLDSNGGFITNWSVAGTAIALDYTANGVNILLLDFYGVNRFDTNGELLGYFGSGGTNAGQFDAPTDIAVDSTGKIYVLDTGNKRVQVFNTNNAYIRSVADSGKCLAVDSSGNLYVGGPIGTAPGARISVYDSSGTFITNLFKGVASGDPDSIAGLVGTEINDIAFDPSGNLYIIDTSSYERVQKFSADWKFISMWGICTGITGSFHGMAVTADHSGNVYVANTSAGIQVFKKR